MDNLDGCYASGVINSSNLGYTEEVGGQLSLLASSDLQKNASRAVSVQGKTIEVAVSPNATKNFRADVLRENTEAVFAACDAAHGRWAKLLGARAALHPKLRLQEFVSIYSISQDFMTASEKIGGRSCFSIRGMLQSQSKAFVDHQHEIRMTKIKAVLDQETWVAVEVPDEFQSIVDWLTSFETSTNGEVTVEHVKPASQTISYRGVSYHMVNCGLILLKMLSEYIEINRSLPLLSSEVIGRVGDILKLFNTRSCHLVLGANAMKVSGLKSITSKHLALASQVASFMHAIITDVKRILLMQINYPRKAQLQADILDRVAEDYKVHRDEIHNKLVQIMRERVLAHLRTLPQIVDGWNRPEDSDPLPSQFARSLTKEVTYLNRVLSRTLLEVDVQLIFRQVVQILHSQISKTFSALEIITPQANNSSNEAGVPNYGNLDDLLAQ